MAEPDRYRFLFASALFTGNAVFFANLRESISGRQDIDSTWVPIELQPNEWIARIPPVSMNWTLKGGLVARSRVRSHEKSGKRFDAAFFNHIIPPYFLYEFRKRVPSVISMDVTPRLFDLYGKWYNHPVSDKRAYLERIKHNLARAIYADAVYLLPWSTWVKNSLVTDYGIAEQKVRVVPPGVNLERWKSPARERPASSTVSETAKILFVGGDFQRKGGDLLLNLACREQFRCCEFHFVTRMPVGDHPDNVIIHMGIEANSEVLRALYREADIFVLPTRADLHSLVSLEAMAMALPVITTDVGALAEIVIEGENGFIVPVDDKEKLADRLLRLVKDVELRTGMGLHARRTVESKFDLKRNANTVVELLKEAAAIGRR